MLLDVIEHSRANDITVSMATNIINMRESARRKRRESGKHGVQPQTEQITRRGAEGGRGAYKTFHCHLLERPTELRSWLRGNEIICKLSLSQNTERALSPSQFIELKLRSLLQVRREHLRLPPGRGSIKPRSAQPRTQSHLNRHGFGPLGAQSP